MDRPSQRRLIPQLNRVRTYRAMVEDHDRPFLGKQVAPVQAKKIPGESEQRVTRDRKSARTAFDNIPVPDEQLQWITGTSARWDGYLDCVVMDDRGLVKAGPWRETVGEPRYL